MEYSYEITVTAGTAKAAPITQDCQLSKGIIHHYDIVFPEGCNNMVSIAVFNGGFQCFPLNPDGAIKGNAEPVAKSTYYPLDDRPYLLTVKGWAPDTTYDHTILIRFDVLPEEYFDKSSELGQAVREVLQEVQEQYADVTSEIAAQLTMVTELLSPVPAPEPVETEGEAEPEEETDAEILARIRETDLIRIKAMVRLYTADKDIIRAFLSNEDYTEELLQRVLDIVHAESEGG